MEGAPMGKLTRDAAEIQRALPVLFTPGDVVELRILDAQTSGDRRPHIESGYFDDWAKLAEAAATIGKAKGWYVTLNPVNSALLARAHNRIRPAGKEPTTSDNDIIRRCWLPIDLDAVRPAGISSTDEEHKAALDFALTIRDHLAAVAWPEPIMADSANGAHLLYRIDLPADDGGLVERCLKALAAHFGARSDKVDLDTTVHNPARIWKLYGTPACKGDSTAERPHRMARLLAVPSTIEIVPVELLEALAGPAAIVEPTATRQQSNGRFDLDEWIARHGLQVDGPQPWRNGGRRWVFSVCPWNPEHRNRSAFIVEWPSGTIGAGCQHNGCAGKGWHDLRDIIEPGWREKQTAKRSGRRETAKAKKVLPPYVPFPTDTLPKVAADFIHEGAAALGCDESYVALPLLAMLASAVGNSRCIRLKRTWCAPAMIWAVVVGKSGTLKSPAHDLAMKPVRHVQNAALKEYGERMEDYNRDKALYDADLAAWKKSGRKNGEPPPEPPAEPVAVRYLVSDCTVEALAVLLEQRPRGLLVERDELSGWVNSFDAYKSCRGADVAHWLSMHRAGSLTVDRKSGRRTIHVPRAAVCIAGGVQPKALAAALIGRYRPQDAAPEAMNKPDKEHFDNGLAARLLFAMPPPRPKRWTEDELPLGTEAALEAIVGRLLALDMPEDENGQPQPIDIPLTAQGKRAWINFYNAHSCEQAKMADDLAAAWSKLEGYAARFALLVHLIRAESDDPTLADAGAVDERSIAAGVTLSRWFGDEAARVYAIIGGDAETPEAREQRELVRIIRDRGGEITARQLMQASRRYRASAEEAEAALGRLVTAEVADVWEDKHGAQGGRPVLVFTLRDSGNGNTTGEIPEEDEVVLPLPPPEESESEVTEWTG
jgi:hypothetical protein